MDYPTRYICEAAGNSAVRLEIRELHKQHHHETKQIRLLRLTASRPSQGALDVLSHWRDEQQRVEVDGVRSPSLLLHDIEAGSEQVVVTMIDDSAG